MHELAVAQALVEQVDAVIDRHSAGQDASTSGAWRASLVRVHIGPLAGVVPELLASAFPLAAMGRRMEHATLELVQVPIRVRCRTCDAETDAEMSQLVCGACGDWHTQLVSGDALLLESVELEATLPPLRVDQHV